METKKVVTYYIPVVPITFILLVLKLAGVIQIEWFWVFFPLWIAPAIFLGVMVVILVIVLLVAIIQALLS
jgi:hypothetical protein